MTEDNQELGQALIQIKNQIEESLNLEVYHTHHRKYSEIATINIELLSSDERDKVESIFEEKGLRISDHETVDPLKEEMFTRYRLSNK